MTPDEQARLIDELLEGIISDADFLRLEADMLTSREARDAYYERLKLQTTLELEAERKAAEREKTAEPARSGSKVIDFPRMDFFGRHRWLARAAAAVIALLALGVGWKMGQNGNGDSNLADAETEPAAVGFGVITGQSGAEWANDKSLGHGDLVPEGTLALRGGIVQVELFSGVTLIIEGEAEFELLSSMEMSVTKGKVRAQVPELARGFRVHTASGDVVDLGTEFSLNVTPEHADVHVLEGEVEWHPLSKPKRTLLDGDALRWTAEGSAADLPPGAVASDSRIEAIASQLAGQREQRREAWHRHSLALREDPRLLAYFPMDREGGWSRQLIDESSAERHGTIVRSERTADRWDHPNRALDFSPTGSRVRVNVSGEHASLTFYCWARIDSLDRWYNSLFLTDGHELHEPHWQIMNDGRLFFSVKRRDATEQLTDKHVAYSPSFWTPALSGKWIQIATVYDTGNWTTTHYVNGEAISVDEIPENMRVETVRIGAASIGNWSEPMRDDPHFAVRNLNGAIDEFAIFSAALSAEEIRELYEIGKP